MLTGDQIRRARQRAGLTQGDLAKALGVSLRTVGNWERDESSPRGREHTLRELLFPQGHDEDRVTTALRQASDAELISEVARRLGRAQEILYAEVGTTTRPPRGSIPTTQDEEVVEDEHDSAPMNQADHQSATNHAARYGLAAHPEEDIPGDALPEDGP